MEPASVCVTDKDNELQSENARLRRLLEQAGVDAAASDVANKLQKLLIAELHHRVKNLLSMVLSITSQTLRSAPNLEDASKAIQSRIMILARSFDLLVEREIDAAPLQAIIETAAEPYNEAKRIAVTVPELSIAALPALSIALVINELCTNAVKYGALAQTGGGIDITGAVCDETLSLVWAEWGGPTVRPPSSRGFGTRMISAVIPEAAVDLDFQSSGLICRIQVPCDVLRT